MGEEGRARRRDMGVSVGVCKIQYVCRHQALFGLSPPVSGVVSVSQNVWVCVGSLPQVRPAPEKPSWQTPALRGNETQKTLSFRDAASSPTSMESIGIWLTAHGTMSLNFGQYSLTPPYPHLFAVPAPATPAPQHPSLVLSSRLPVPGSRTTVSLGTTKPPWPDLMAPKDGEMRSSTSAWMAQRWRLPRA
jgi:hypothetical protein